MKNMSMNIGTTTRLNFLSPATTFLLALGLLAAAGCSGGPSPADQIDYKTGAAKQRPLDMPPDLVLPRTEGKYVVPEGTETSTTYSEYAKNVAAQSQQNQSCICKDGAQANGAPAKITPPPAAATVPPKLADRADGSKSILIAEPFDRCWLKVSQALDKAAIAVEDKDRSKGIFYLKARNVLNVQAKAAEPGKPESCEVTATDGSGASTADTKRIIDALYNKGLGVNGQGK